MSRYKRGHTDMGCYGGLGRGYALLELVCLSLRASERPKLPSPEMKNDTCSHGSLCVPVRWCSWLQKPLHEQS